MRNLAATQKKKMLSRFFFIQCFCVSYSVFGIMKWLSKNDAKLPSTGIKNGNSEGKEERKEWF